MNAFKIQFEIVILFFLIFGNTVNYAQNKVVTKQPFVRVYDLSGKKIGKGKVSAVYDSLLVLNQNNKTVRFVINDIGIIKTKRSAGHNVLTGTLTGAGVGVVLGVVSANPDEIWGYTAGEGALAFGAMGAIGGAAIGGISVSLKKSETYVIDGDLAKWNIFKEVILESMK